MLSKEHGLSGCDDLYFDVTGATLCVDNPLRVGLEFGARIRDEIANHQDGRYLHGSVGREANLVNLPADREMAPTMDFASWAFAEPERNQADVDGALPGDGKWAHWTGEASHILFDHVAMKTVRAPVVSAERASVGSERGSSVAGRLGLYLLDGGGEQNPINSPSVAVGGLGEVRPGSKAKERVRKRVLMRRACMRGRGLCEVRLCFAREGCVGMLGFVPAVKKGRK